MNKLLMVLGAASLAAALCGCGGGGNDQAPAAPAAPTAAVPPSATASVAGLISYLQALIATGSSADTLQPVDVSNVTLPTSDTASPTPVN